MFLLMAATCRTPEIKDGSLAYKLKKYELATRLLPADYEKAETDGDRARFAWMIGNSYRYIGKPEEAAHWYLESYQAGNVEAREWVARMYMASGKYDAAIAEYKELMRDEPFRRNEFMSAITACESAIAATKGETTTELTNLSINSANADFAPARYQDGLVFVSSRPGSTGELNDDWTGNPFYDLYFARATATGFEEPSLFSTALSGAFNEGPASFDKSFTTVYYTQCGTEDVRTHDYCQIMVSTRQPDGGWSPGVGVTLFEDLVNVGQPVLAKEGKMLIFTANDSLGGYGGSDLYYSVETFEGWSRPVNMGTGINTPYDEAFAYVDADGNLWYASNGLPGFGGLDIFKARPSGQTWANPQNAGYPLNSSGDDFGVIIDKLTKEEQYSLEMKGIVTSSRSGGQGSDDIYTFEVRKPPAAYVLKGRTLSRNYKDPNDPKSEVLGLIPLPGTQVDITNPLGSAVEVARLTSDREGNFEAVIKADTDYRLVGSHEPGYLNKSESVTTRGLRGDPGTTTTVTVDIILDKRFDESKELEIPNIYYDFRKWNIRSDAAAVLDSTILVILKDNPGIIVELGSHTDTRGSTSSNKTLAENRAKAAVDYLITKGIEPARLRWNGYGESRPVVSDAEIARMETEEEKEAAHQRNRRTTFRVLKEKYTPPGQP
jgi:outer membrane protein OmpA-like peptidoglycan-associated protein